MENQIKESIEKLAKKAIDANSAIESQQYAQAVLNLSNALASLGDSWLDK